MGMTVAVIAMGEMGSGVAARLVERGAKVRTNLAGRSEASAARAKAAGVQIAADDTALVKGCDLVLSIVPPAPDLLLPVRIGEQLLDRDPERRGDAEGEVKGGVVPLGLEGVYGVAGDPDLSGELLLGQAPLGAQDLQAALHACDLWIRGVARPNIPQNSG